MSRFKSNALVIALSVSLGLMIGLVVASHFEWANEGLASHQPVATQTQSENAISSSDIESTSRAFVEIAKRITPTVVSITSEKVIRVRDPFADFFGNDDFFRRFFRVPDDGEREYRRNGLGSGVIVSSDGYILTNYHVIKDADEINVVLDKDELQAEIVGTDPATDLAVLKINKDNLPTIKLGDSDKLEVGEWVLAVGSPFQLSLEHTVTSGIVSAKGRALNLGTELTYQDFIQTDAAINPGNSGGALVNIKGELIGINTAIYSGNTGGNLGIGFAIPVNLAKHVMDDLIDQGKVVRGYLGVRIGPLDSEMAQALTMENKQGAVVVEVQEETPAARAGLKKYDVIVGVDGRQIDDPQMLTNLIASYGPGDRINVKVVRDGETRSFSITLTERPSEGSAASVTPSSVISKLGIDVTELTDRLAERYGYSEDQGVLITEVTRGSVAEEKGLRAGDLVVEVNRQKVSSVSDLVAQLDQLSTGEIVLFQVKRQRATQFVAMKIPKS